MNQHNSSRFVINEMEHKGIQECPHNTVLRESVIMDEEAVMESFKKVSPSVNVKECIRLGKYMYSQNSSRPRLLLVKLNRISVVLDILSSPLFQHIFQIFLLKKGRWNLFSYI